MKPLTWNLERKIKRSEHDRGEDPPSEHIHYERERSPCNSEAGGCERVSPSKRPMGACQARESRDEEEEDEQKDYVGTQSAHHVDKAEDTHPEQIEC